MHAYLKVGEAAKTLRVCEETVRRWCRGGTLAGARQVGKQWLIPRSTILFDALDPEQEGDPTGDINAEEDAALADIEGLD